MLLACFVEASCQVVSCRTKATMERSRGVWEGTETPSPAALRLMSPASIPWMWEVDFSLARHSTYTTALAGNLTAAL